MAELTPAELQRLYLTARMKNFLTGEEKRSEYTTLILTFRQNNEDHDLLLSMHFQRQFLIGYMRVFEGDLISIVNAIHADSNEETFDYYHELLARYFLDVADGHIE